MRDDGPGQPPGDRTFYRIVKTDPATRADFLSLRALGRSASAGLTPRQLRQWEGISVFATREQALRQARRYPRLGRFIAEIRIAAGGPVRYERTNRDSPGHHTLWGTPHDLQQAVAIIVPIAIAMSEEENNGQVV